jgi:hypothetical protein
MSRREPTVQDIIGTVAGRNDAALLVDVDRCKRTLILEIVQQLSVLSIHSGVAVTDLPVLLRCRYTDQQLTDVDIKLLEDSRLFLELVIRAVEAAVEDCTTSDEVETNAVAAISLTVQTHHFVKRADLTDASQETLVSQTGNLLFDDVLGGSPIALLAKGDTVQAFETVATRLERLELV